MVVALGALVLAGCAAGDPRFTLDEPAGFWVGLWHGIISIITLVIGVFSDGVRVYEVHNTGGWYDFGFLLGVTAVWGGGSSTAHRRRVKSRREQQWEEIGRMVESKVRRKVREWAEAEPGEDWSVVEAKAEDKLKRRFREWASKP